MICTFYSFKGGVGRSMALANVAELLYRRGLNVLIMDFDLEAPGLERYFDVSNAINNPVDIQEKRGIIDMLISYKELRSLPPLNFSSSPKNEFFAEPIANFIVPIYKTGAEKGALSIMPAGCRAGEGFTKYAEKIRFFDWNDFFANWEGERFFNWFREELEKNYDIVLIDSRTGVTEMAGVCTYQLADIVVLFVTANRQSFDGTKMMAGSLKHEKLIQEGRAGRALHLLFVPSRVERGEAVLQDDFKADFEESFGNFFKNLKFEQGVFLDLRIPYILYYAYTEQVAVRDFEDPSKQARSLDLNKAYERLTITIAQLAPKDTPLYKSFSHVIEKLASISDSRYIVLAPITVKIKSSASIKINRLPNLLPNLLPAAKAYQKAGKIGLDIHIQENLKSAMTWMKKVFNNKSWDEVELAYDYIHQASEILLQAQLHYQDKEIWLKEIQGLAVQAAYALAKNNQLQTAVMTLEQGLARFFSESLKHYDFTDIQQTTKEVPLVYMMMTELGGLALIVQDTITPIWLPELTTQVISKTNYLELYFHWQKESKEPVYAIKYKNDFFKKLEETGSWLWQSVMQPLMTALSPHSKVMLIPVGELNSLPFHAAWRKDETAVTGKRYVLDILTIAYIPNARILIEAKKMAERVSANTLLAVGNPEPVRASPLLNSEHEIDTIASSFKQSQILKGKAANRETVVLNALPNNTVLHFSCHGSFNFSEPLNSGLVMANDEFLSLGDLLDSHLNVRLATLSACETGISGKILPDEAMSFANGFLQAGAAGVVASFWDLFDDILSMMIMIRFYDFWRQEKLEPVAALRQAQLWMRDSTNGEKLDYFKPRTDEITFKQIRNTIGFSKKEERNFAHPFYWATFTYVGV